MRHYAGVIVIVVAFAILASGRRRHHEDENIHKTLSHTPPLVYVDSTKTRPNATGAKGSNIGGGGRCGTDKAEADARSFVAERLPECFVCVWE